jgi:phage virion morphogenesis protein
MLELTLDGLSLGEQRLAAIRAGLVDLQPLFTDLAAVAESQTRRRIESERESPSGIRWQDWSPGYAKTRHGGQSLLQGSGNLLDSLTRFADKHSGGVGTNLKYARIHQFGGTAGMRPGPAAIPARPYLGFSEDNLDEIRAICNDYLDNLLGGEA